MILAKGCRHALLDTNDIGDAQADGRKWAPTIDDCLSSQIRLRGNAETTAFAAALEIALHHANVT
jgi:hypothetical protein